MDFGIRVKIDPGDAKPVVDGVTASLDRAEAAGPKAGAAISSGLKQAQTAAAGATKGISDLNAALGVSQQKTAAVAAEDAELAESLQLVQQALAREAKVLAEVLGPMRQLEEEIDTINRLHEKGKLSTDQFTDAIARRNKALASMQSTSSAGFDSTAAPQYGPTYDPTKAGQGGGGSGAGGLNVLGAVAAVTAIGGMVHALATLGDEYTELENKTRKFTAAGVSTQETMRQQIGLSADIRASLEDTIALTDRVTVATRNLYLTQQQQAEITRGLGLAAKVDNVPLEQMDATIRQLTFAADTGTFTMRSLRDMFASMPTVGKTLLDHFHLTQKAFIDMALQGKISGREILLSFGGNVSALQEKVEKFGETLSDSQREWLAKFTGTKEPLSDAEKSTLALAESALRAQNQLHLESDALMVLADSLKTVKTVTEGLFTNLMNDRLKTYATNLEAIHAKAQQLAGAKTVIDMLHAFGLADDAQQAQTNHDNTAAQIANNNAGKSYGDVATGTAQGIQDLREQYTKLVATARDSTVGAREQAEAWKKAREVAHQLADDGSELFKIWNGLTEAQRIYREDMAAVNYLFEHGKISLSQYGVELGKVLGQLQGDDIRKLLATQHLGALQIAANANAGTKSPLAGLGPASYETDTFLAGDSENKGNQNDLEKDKQKRAAQIAAIGGAIAAYRKEQEDLRDTLSGGDVSIEDRARAFEDLRKKYDDMQGPQEKFADGVRDADQKLAAGIYTVDEYTRKLEQLRLAAGKGTFADGVHEALAQIAKDGTQAKLGMDLATAGVQDLNTAILDVAIQGKQSWTEFFGSMIDQLAKLGLQFIEARLLAAAFASSTGGLGGLGSAGAIGGFVGGIVGAHANGVNWTSIPSYANGKPPSGVDSVPFMAWTSPGEQVSIASAQEVARAKQGGAGGVTQHFNYYDNGDPRALAPIRKELSDLRELVERSRRAR